MAPRDDIVTITGCATRIMRQGTGAPLIYLHGANGAPRWLPFMAMLAKEFDVIVPEHPGYGGSASPDWLDNVGDLAFFYLDLIDHLGLAGVNVVGTSMGGWIAAEMAVRNCTKLASLVLSGPAGIHVNGLERADIFMWSPEETVRQLLYDQKLAEEILAQPVSEAQQMTVLKNRLATAKLGWQPRMHNPDLAKWLHRISVPTLILWGEEDRLISKDYGPAFRDLIPGARLKTFPECGHTPQVEKAEDYAATVSAFIREARS
jgi:pimeloyl-ACP methyl ester carboxylesterase